MKKMMYLFYIYISITLENAKVKADVLRFKCFRNLSENYVETFPLM